MERQKFEQLEVLDIEKMLRGSQFVDFHIRIGDIKGESESVPDFIRVLWWSWGMVQPASMHIDKGGGAGQVSVYDLEFLKRVDTASPELAFRCCSGQHYPDAELQLRKAGGDSKVPYLRIQMTEVMIKTYQAGFVDPSNGIVLEKVSLNFAEFRVAYQAQESDGVPGPEFSKSWSMRKGTVGSG